MKSYDEMIQFIADQVEDGIFRYYEWPAVIAIAEAYGVPQATVFDDVKSEKELREKTMIAAKRAWARASNEERRLANLAKKEV